MFSDFSWMSAMTSSPIFVVLVLCSVATLGVAAERLIYYWKRRGNPDETLESALRKIRAGVAPEAAWACWKQHWTNWRA